MREINTARIKKSLKRRLDYLEQRMLDGKGNNFVHQEHEAITYCIFLMEEKHPTKPWHKNEKINGNNAT